MTTLVPVVKTVVLFCGKNDAEAGGLLAGEQLGVGRKVQFFIHRVAQWLPVAPSASEAAVFPWVQRAAGPG